jgi:hypothetical protein
LGKQKLSLIIEHTLNQTTGTVSGCVGKTFQGQSLAIRLTLAMQQLQKFERAYST